MTEREPRWRIGQEVPVRYLPADPARAELDDPLRRWRYPALSFGAGLTALVIGFARARRAG